MDHGVPRRFLLYRRPLPPEWESAWQVFERLILQFVEEARRQGARFALLSVPASQVVSARAWQQLVELHPAMADVEWDVEGPERRLRELARAHGIPLIQPYRRFQEAAKDTALFFGPVGHMTPSGHHLMASVLEDFVSEATAWD